MNPKILIKPKPMKVLFLCILVLSLLTSITTQGFSEKPLRLFFEKKISAEQTPDNKASDNAYKVQEGDWLFKILQKQGMSDNQIYNQLPAIQSMNPDIPDINHLKPGQILHLPDQTSKEHKEHPAEQSVQQKKGDSAGKSTYIVRPGQTVAEILHEEAKIPMQQVFNGYLDKFIELNPGIKNIHALKVGQEIVLPQYAGQGNETAAAPRKARPPVQDIPDLPMTILPSDSSADKPQQEQSPAKYTDIPSPAPATDNATQDRNATAATRLPATGLPLIRTVLSQMRFSFIPGDEAMFPVGDKQWLHLKMSNTPLLEAPWGSKFLLNPVPQSQDWYALTKAVGFKVCPISPAFGLREVLQSISDQSADNFHLWTSNHDLTISRSGLSITVLAPETVVAQQGGQKTIYVVWNRSSKEEPPLPQGLPEVLGKAQIKVIELDIFNDLSRLPSLPTNSVYMPTATPLEIIRAMNPQDPEALFGKSVPTVLNDFLYLLKTKNLLQQGVATMTWERTGRKISVQAPAWLISSGQNRIVLLQRNQADEHLVALLAHEGYTCFVLPE